MSATPATSRGGVFKEQTVTFQCGHFLTGPPDDVSAGDTAPCPRCREPRTVTRIARQSWGRP